MIVTLENMDFLINYQGGPVNFLHVTQQNNPGSRNSRGSVFILALGKERNHAGFQRNNKADRLNCSFFESIPSELKRIENFSKQGSL